MPGPGYATFYIVRHGETEWNAAGRMQGHGDSPLTQAGERQASDLGNLFKSVHFDAVFSSDLLRAKRTAELITLERQLAVNTSALLRERSYGKYEGRAARDYQAENREIFKRMEEMSDEERWHFQLAEDMESDGKVAERMLTFLREAAATYPGKTLLAVAHGGIMRMMLIRLGFGTRRELPGGSIENTAWVKLETDGVDFNILETKGVHKRT